MRTIQKRVKFSKGELSPKLAERSDLDLLDSSASFIQNYISTPYGGFKTRQGTIKYDKLTDATYLLVPFIYSQTEKYMLLFSNEEIKVYENKVLVATISAPDLLDDYFDILKFTQIEDVMILTHPNLKYKQFSRFKGGNTSLVPVFSTGETTKDGFTISATSPDPYKIFDDNVYTYDINGNDTYHEETASSVEPTTYDANLLNTVECDFDSERSVKTIQILLTNIKSYTLYGKLLAGGTELIKTETFTGTPGVQQEITTELTADYDGIQLDVVGIKNSVEDAGNNPWWVVDWYPVQVNDLKVFEQSIFSFEYKDFDIQNVPYDLFGEERETDFSIQLTSSVEEGSAVITAASAIFDSSNVGQYIDTPAGSRFKITAFESSTKVSGYTIIPFLSTTIPNWTFVSGYEPIWSETRGYPNTCLVYQQRLWFGGSKSKPQTVAGSRVGQYNDFNNVGSYSNDAIIAKISSVENNNIVNLFDNRGLQIYTNSDEYVAGENTLTPDDISIIKTTSNGSLQKTSPIAIAGTSFFIENNGKSILSFVYNEVQANYITGNMSLMSSHLIENPKRMVVDYNSRRDEANFLYLLKEDGELLVSCILLDQQVNSFSRIKTSGNVIDVAVLDSEVYILNKVGSDVYLEVFDDVLVDEAIIKSPSLTITGLEDYESREVRVYNDDDDYGLHTVSSGEITLDTLPTNDVYVGIDFNCKLVSNKIVVGNQTESIKKRISKAMISTINTDELTINGKKSVVNNDGLFIFGSVSGFSRKNEFTIESTFKPIEVLSIVLNINYGES